MDDDVFEEMRPVLRVNHPGRDAVGAVFSGPRGREALEWLKSITTEVTLDPTHHTSERLWHMEGCRHMVQLLQNMVREAENGK
jgi:hypothetical protein